MFLLIMMILYFSNLGWDTYSRRSGYSSEGGNWFFIWKWTLVENMIIYNNGIVIVQNILNGFLIHFFLLFFLLSVYVFYLLFFIWYLIYIKKNKTWSLVSNSSSIKTFALASLENFKFTSSVFYRQRLFSLKFILDQKKFCI